MAYKTVTLKCDTVGGAGAAVGSADCGCPTGRVSGVQVKYNGACPATTNVNLSAVLDGQTKKVFEVLADNTDIPLQAVCEEPMTPNMVTIGYVPLIVAGRFILSVTDCDELTDAVEVILILDILP